MEFQIVFHVQEENEAGAEEWRRRAKAILDTHQIELVAPRQVIVKPDGTNANVGSYCQGHVAVSDDKSPSDTPSKVLQMGPRE